MAEDAIVTGGAGFIGSNLVDALLARGDRVTVVDNLSTGKPENLKDALAQGATLREADIRDGEVLERIFAEVKPTLVFHLAAQADVRVSVARPAFDLETNVKGTVNVLEAARAAGSVKRLVNTSTGGGLYGDARVLPTPEDPPIEPGAPYGQGKLAAEGYCGLYERLHGLSTVSLRYGNVYGPRQDTHGEAGVVAIFCGCLLDGTTPTIYGDGTQTRDWVEVSDVVAANLLAAGQRAGGSFNIGTQHETSVLDLVGALKTVGQEFGLAAHEPILAQARLGEVQRSCMDITRAKQVLGWEAKVELVDGLRRIMAGLVGR